MTVMKSVQTAASAAIEVLEIERPAPGPNDVLLRVRACGICGTDTTFVHMGGMPLGPGGQTTPIPLGHEPAGEIVEVGAHVTGLRPGDRVVVNPQAAPSGIIGCGGALGGMREYLLIENAVEGQSLALIPDTVPFDVAALNESMAVARHCVNRSQARTTDKVVVFGAGPIGLGATIWLKLRGVTQVTVADVIPGRLQTALAIGADAVIGSQGYPTEIFEVTPELAAHQERFARLISHRVPFSDVEQAFKLTMTPGAAEKVVVTFDD